MPTYSYKCQDCQSEFDIVATIQEKIANHPDKFFCPDCRSTKIQQAFNLAALIKKANSKGGGCVPGGGCCG